LARQAAAGKDADERAAHVGFYLIDMGLPQLRRAMGVYESTAEAIQKWIGRSPLLLYLVTITLMTVVFTATLLMKAQAGGVGGWALALMGVLLLLSTSHPAVALVNWPATLTAAPHLLPRMDFSKGIPPESRTLVVIRTMITSVQNIEALAEGLGKAPRPFLQLVRHGVSETTGTSLHLDRGQREPRRSSADLAIGPAGTCRSKDPGVPMD